MSAVLGIDRFPKLPPRELARRTFAIDSIVKHHRNRSWFIPGVARPRQRGG
jgi:hypothetical protein